MPVEPTSLSSPAISPNSGAGRKNIVGHRVLRGILHGEFREGDRLTEQALAEQFGVSRTPVREALLELEGLGVVELKRNCGAVVTRFGEVKLREIYEVRRLLEVEATRKACGRIDPQQVEALITASEQLLQGPQFDEDWKLDVRIHSSIAEACGNRRLAHEIGRYTTLVQAVRDTVGERMPVQKLTIQEHLQILQAMIRNDPDAAGEAMQSHLLQAEESAVLAIS